MRYGWQQVKLLETVKYFQPTLNLNKALSSSSNVENLSKIICNSLMILVGRLYNLTEVPINNYQYDLFYRFVFQ